MKTEVTEVSPTQKEITIEIAPDEVRGVFQKVCQKYARGASVPGFRKGMAPVDIIKLRFKDEIHNETLRELLPDRITKAITESGLNPLAEPHVHLEDQDNLKLNGSMPVSVHVHVEVMPETPMPDYASIEAVRRVRPVTEEEIEERIEARRQGAASLIPVEDRPAQEGDTLIVDLQGIFEADEAAEPIVAEDLELTLGDKNIEESFTENLKGVLEDEEKEFTVSYAEDFTSPGLAGKTVHYKALIKSVGTREVPEATDDWARELDEEVESLSELRAKVRTHLELISKNDADNLLRDEIVTKLIDANEFEVPNTLVQTQARNLLNNFAQDMAGRGMDIDKLDEKFVRMAYENMLGQAEKDVRGALLLDKVAEAENVEVTGDEIAAEIERIAEYYGVGPEEVRASLTKQGGENSIADRLRSRKAVDALVNKAKVSDGEWIDPADQKPENLESQADATVEASETPAETAEPETSSESEKTEPAPDKKPKARKKKAD
jgi:trigger factor